MSDDLDIDDDPIPMDIDDDAFVELSNALSTSSDLKIGQKIKVLIIPVAHGGVRDTLQDEKKLVQGMDVKLITSTPGTCTLMSPNSYTHLISSIAAIVKSNNHYQYDFENQLLEFFNIYQNYTVDKSITKQPMYTEQGKKWHRIQSNRVPEGYIDVVANTYTISDYNDNTTSTKMYYPIPKKDPLWYAFLAVTKVMNVDPLNYSEIPFVIYMYKDHNNVFHVKISPSTNTTKNISLNQILYNTNKTIKKELEGRDVCYIVADPNCSYKIKSGGRSSKKYKKNKKNTKRNKRNYKKKSRKVSLKLK